MKELKITLEDLKLDVEPLKLKDYEDIKLDEFNLELKRISFMDTRSRTKLLKAIELLKTAEPNETIIKSLNLLKRDKRNRGYNMNIKELSKGDRCLQKVIDGNFKGDLWEVMEVLFDESDNFYLQETLIESKNTLRKFRENEIKTFKDEIYIENIEEVSRAVKKSYHELRVLQREYELGTPERLLVDKHFSEIKKIDTSTIDFLLFVEDKKDFIKYSQV